MKNLFDPTLVEDVKLRIVRLDAESGRQWGKMSLAQTLAHCTYGVQMAMGIINPRRASFPANALGALIKPPIYDPIRNDPRFQHLLRRARLDQ
jgi:hypothetical protein